MSERMAAEISIGGKIPAQLVDELCGAIDAAGVALEWGDGFFSPKTSQDLLKARTERDGALVLWLCDEQASWGRFDGLEGFLREHGIPFTRRNDGGAVYDGALVEYRPDSDTICLPTNSDGEPVIAVSLLAPADGLLAGALEQLENGSTDKAASMLRDAQRRLREQLPPAFTPLEPFEIIADGPPPETQRNGR